MIGIRQAIQSFGDLGASVVVGILWSLVSPTVAFGHAEAGLAMPAEDGGATWCRQPS
ncbi:MAG TPA: hypothetical protein VK894_06590 [Jiangellales bacterium]|nr:hypothetical protein [Jiangellales bacterium]